MPAEDDDRKAMGSASTDPGLHAAPSAAAPSPPATPPAVSPSTRSEHPEPLAGPARTVLGGVGLPAPQAPSTMLMNAEDAPGAAAAPAPSNTPLAGKVVKGRYRIKRLLGEGGMGGVFEGEHIEIGRRVAIKLVSSVHARDPHVAARIKQEARSTGAIESEHIVQVFDAGEDEELGLFLVMELLKGEDLAAMLARETRLSPVVAITLVAQAAQGLARAHAARIVHRDLKPANIFISPRDDGSLLVKLVDFGIAKLLRDASDKEAGGLTRLGMVIGTPQYMSPEQAQGLTTVDHRTDIYSLGAVLFEIVAGVPPIQQMPTYEQTILQIMMKQAPRLRSIVPDAPQGLDDLCADMMASDPAARPQEMSLVRDRLVRLLADLGGAPVAGASATGGWRALDVSGAWRTSSLPGEAAPASVVAAAAAARVSPASGGTQSAVAVDPLGPHSGHLDEIAGVPGLPQKRSGLVGVAAAVLVAAVAGGLFYVRSSSSSVSAAASPSVGLVEATGAVGAPPATASASAPASSTAATTTSSSAAVAASSPTPAVSTSASASVAVTAASAASAVIVDPAKTPSTNASSHASRPKSGGGTTAGHAPTSAGQHQVGATPAAEEF